MKGYLTVIIFLLISFKVSAQVNIDSTKIVIDGYEGKQKVDALNKLAVSIFNQEPKESEEYARTSLHLAKELVYLEGQAEALKVIGSLFNSRFELKEGRKVLNEALVLAKKASYQHGVATINYSLGSNYFKSGLDDLAIKCYIEGLEYARRLNHVGLQMSNLLNLGILKAEIGEYEEAEKYIYEGIELSEAGNNFYNTGHFIGTLGNIQFDIGNYAMAEKYQLEALGIVKNIKAKLLLVTSWTQLGRVYTKLNQEKKALLYLDSAQELSVELGNKRNYVSILRHRADTYLEFDKYEESMLTLNQALAMKEGYRESPYIRKDLYAIGVTLNEKIGNFKEALDFHKLLLTLKDSLLSEQNFDRVTEINAKFNFDQLRNKAEAEKQLNQINRLKINQRNLIILILTIVVVVSLFFFLLNRRRFKQKLLIAHKDQLLLERESQLKNYELMAQNEKINFYVEELSKIERESAEGTNESRLIELLKASNSHALDWAEFKMAFDQKFPKFFKQLESHQLSTNEQRLSSLIRIGLSNKEVSRVLSISPNSVAKAKSRLAVKMNLTSKEMDHFLKEF